MTYVSICSHRLRLLVGESQAWHDLLAAGVDSWQDYDSVDWSTEEHINIAYADAIARAPQWSSVLPTEETPDVLLHWIDDGQHKYCLGTFAKDNEGVMQFYDDENNELSFIPTNDAWIQITPPAKESVNA